MGKSKSDVAAFGEDKKKISQLHLLVYIIDIIDYRYRYRLLLSNGEITYGYKCPD